MAAALIPLRRYGDLRNSKMTSCQVLRDGSNPDGTTVPAMLGSSSETVYDAMFTLVAAAMLRPTSKIPVASMSECPGMWALSTHLVSSVSVGAHRVVNDNSGVRITSGVMVARESNVALATASLR